MRTVYAAVAVFFLALLAGFGFLLHRPFHGYSAHVVLSGSMEPALSVGDLVIERAVGTAVYRQGDVITFTVNDGKNMTVTHRIMRRVRRGNGAETIETKGDANTDGDPWEVSPVQVVGVVVARVPVLGYPLHYVRTPRGFIAVSAFLFFAFVMAELYRLMRTLETLALRVRSRFENRILNDLTNELTGKTHPFSYRRRG